MRTTEKFVACTAATGSPPASWSPVWMLSRADAEGSYPAGHPCAGVKRDLLPPVEAYIPAVEQHRRVAAAERPGAGPAEREQPLVLQKEFALLGKEQREAREVDLLLVRLHLGEVRVDGEIGRQVLRDAVLDVEAARAAEVVAERVGGHQVARHVADSVRLDLDEAGRGRRLEADHRGRQRRAEVPVVDERRRHRREIRHLVLPAVGAPRLETPDLLAAGAVAQRLERDGRLDDVAAVEIAGREVPDRVPVDIDLRLVGDLTVDAAADRVDLEQYAVAVVVETCRSSRRSCRCARWLRCRAASRSPPGGPARSPSNGRRHRRCRRRRTAIPLSSRWPGRRGPGRSG